ncbi:S1-like domain-containing RNA-binding protein [Acholeplasma granularum]|uniref:S1-like domain-containing RNA-binding protein n=1 Tax=Acholeplasma granularum TaxID=264635 RepID=UPI0004711FCB|nr:S1-like domain-containing RNA-binding protein [Acholeplasma granularum]
MSLKIGQTNELQVLRKTDIAYVLKSKSNEEVFLHINESNHRTLKAGDYVDAFLYYDAKGRLAATLSEPFVEAGKPAVLNVISVNPGLGVFLDMGISKDLLLSKDDLGEDISLWPQVGDKVYVDLRVKTRLSARPIPYNEMRVIVGNLNIGDEVSGFIQVIGQIGYFVLTEEHNLILVKRPNARGKYRLGQSVNVKITYETPTGYEGSLTEFKEVVRIDDSKIIMDFLIKNGGSMPYTATTDSETIQKVFNLSRKSFKRALGLLYKQRKVNFIDNNTILVNENE